MSLSGQPQPHHRSARQRKSYRTMNATLIGPDDQEDTDRCHLLGNGHPKETSVVFTKQESIWATSVQMFIPFLLAGFGMVAASLLLDVVQHWPVYQNVSEVYILVPALLGLKGNLEMTLASRLSTHANLGHLDSRRQQCSLIIGNLALIQCQAIIVGFLASIAALIFGWVPSGKFSLPHAALLCASSVATAFTASLLLGLVMVAVILFSRHMHINPDNVATPIAASLGDLTTLALLSWFATWLYDSMAEMPWYSGIIIITGIAFVPLWAWLASRNEHSKQVLDSGWSPVIIAMVISSVGGLILDYTVSRYKGIAVFQLVINGIGGNLAAVQASRISTSLHSAGPVGYLPPQASGGDVETGANSIVCLSPVAAFCDSSRTQHAATARMLLVMVVPGHLIFSYTISYLQAGHTSFTPIFMLVYLCAAVLQVFSLLYAAQVMVVWMWGRGVDPDNSAIPYLTAIGDLLGTFLLGVAFQLLYIIGDRDSDVGD